MKKQMLLLGATLLVASGLFAQESKDEFKPSGKVTGVVYFNYNSQIGADENPSEFELERAYFGYNYNISKELSTKVLLDIDKDLQAVDENGNDVNLRRNAYFKNAAIFYKKDNLKVGFGIQNTFCMKYQEQIWGRRYITNALIDMNGMSTTADLGVSAEYGNDMFSFDLALFNGETYKKIQHDNAYLLSTGAAAFLLDKKITLRIVNEYVDNGVAQNLTTMFASYATDVFTLGADYNMQSNHKFNEGNDRSGFSVFGLFNINEKFTLLGRYDDLSWDAINPTNDPSEGLKYIIAGVEYKLHKSVRAALNYKSMEDKYDGAETNNFVFLNLEAKF
ncbi:MAG: porin [Marinilabiliaceae bacterium]|nr:porin [Marinilabiliaceae bacterium]